MIDRIIEYVSIFLALIIVLPIHEFAHAFAAVKSGDPTPKIQGRYTLNPLAHFDIYGLLLFIIAKFGWAKPVPVNPYNFRNYKRGCFFVSIAGVSANYILAFIACPLFMLAYKYISPLDLGYFDDVIVKSLYYTYSLSITFFVFNLIPIYPLDGFRVLEVFWTKKGKFYYFLVRYGRFVLYGLILLSFLSSIINFPQINILGRTIGFLADYASYPITAFWGLIF